MKGDITEIAGIINECFYYLNRINYQSKKLYSIDKSYLDLPQSTYEESQKFDKKQAVFLNKCRLTHLKIKPFFTQLIFDLHHLFKFSIFDTYKQPLASGKFTRLKNGAPEDVESFKRAVIFYRDAIGHPEHSTKVPSPRALPKNVYINPSSYFLIVKNGIDFYFQIGEGKIYLKADILKCLKKLKEQCLKNDRKNILRDFKWIK